jgi:hypothetical protein
MKNVFELHEMQAVKQPLIFKVIDITDSDEIIVRYETHIDYNRSPDLYHQLVQFFEKYGSYIKYFRSDSSFRYIGRELTVNNIHYHIVDMMFTDDKFYYHQFLGAIILHFNYGIQFVEPIINAVNQSDTPFLELLLPFNESDKKIDIEQIPNI